MSRKTKLISVATLLILIGLTLAVFNDSIRAAFVIGKKPNTASPSPNVDTLSQGLVGHWSFDEDAGTTVPDHSGQGNTGTATNGPIGTTGQLGRGLQFDGADDYINLTTSAGSVRNLSKYSISAWFKVNTMPSPGGAVQSFWWEAIGTDADSVRTRLFIENASAGYANVANSLTWRMRDTDAGTPVNVNTGANTIQAGQWYHAVAVYDSDADREYIYLNGALQTTGATAIGTVSNTASAGTAKIGVGGQASLSEYFNGSLDDVRVYNRALSADEIKRLYNIRPAVQAKPALSQGLVGYWSFDEDAGTTVPDHSGQGNTGTATNGPTATTGQLGRALQFDGATNYIDVGHKASLINFNTGDFTASAWAYINGSSASFQEIVYSIDGGNYDVSQDGYQLQVISSGGSPANKIQWQITGATSAAIQSDAVPTYGDWHHIVGMRRNGTLFLYVDGVQQAGTAASTESLTDYAGHFFRIGRAWDDFPYYFGGKIDDVRVYNRALSADEVKRLYNIRPPKISSSPANRLTSGLVGYWTFDGADLTTTTATDRSGSGNNGTLSGGPAPAMGKHGQALQFDGVNDYVNLGNNTSLAPANTITISAWINSDLGTQRAIVSRDNLNSDGYLFAKQATGELAWYDYDLTTPGWHNGSTVMAANTWYHVAVTYTSGSLCLYVNGRLDATCASVTGTMSQNVAVTAWIGDRLSDNQIYQGSLDDVRIYNRALSAAEIQQLYNLGR